MIMKAKRNYFFGSSKELESNPNNTHYQFWQEHSHPIELNTNEKLDQGLDNIYNSPIVAGMVRYPEDYLYSSR